MNTSDKNISIYSLEGITESRGQDNYKTFEFDIEGINIKFIGLYNGHGSRGKNCSEYVSNAIMKLILNNKNELSNLLSKDNNKELITKLFADGFKKIQKEMNEIENSPFELSGSTATIALIVNNKVCYIINLGNNRAVIGRKTNTKNDPIQLNKVHDTENKEELERIKKMGGEVRGSTFMRIFKKDDNFYPGLTVSRTLGDCFSHDIISDEPEVNVHNLEKEDAFIILGTDSLWEHMSMQDVVDFVFKKINEKSEMENKIAEEVVKESKKNWIIFHKNKDIKIFEEIKNDPNLDNETKNKKVNDFIQALEYMASYDPQYKKIVDIPPMDKINPNELFHGNHNIPDITCMIYFFGKN